MNVLVIEDDPEINELVGAYAQIAGFHYRSALSGVEALNELRSSRPDLIVLDLMLPDLDGLEICRQVKSAPDTSRIPVVILTALDSDTMRENGLRCGAAEYLTKPFDPDQLMRAMTQHAAQGK